MTLGDASVAIATEQAKAEIIKDLMQDRDFALGGVALRDVWPFPWPGSEQHSPILWCAHFLEDFRTQSGIVHIEPVAAGTPQPNFSGIIRYKGADYVYDLFVDFEIESSDGEQIRYYRLELDAILPASAKRSTPERQVEICDFDNVGVADFAVLGKPTTHWPLTIPELPRYEAVRLALGPQRFDRLSASQQSALIDFALRNPGWFKPLSEGGFAEPLRQAIDTDLLRKEWTEWTNTTAVLRTMEPNSVRSETAIGRFVGNQATFVYHMQEGETLEQAIGTMKYAGAGALHLYLDDERDAYSRPGRPLQFSLPDDQPWMVPDMRE
jgi:hypothetical protein